MSRKTCEICEIRPVMSQAERVSRGEPNFQYCLPCLDKAYAENTHSDYAHDEIMKALPTLDSLKAAELMALATTFGVDGEFRGRGRTISPTKDNLKAELRRIAAELDSCWVCHPELDETKIEYVERAGTSRAGMRMTVRRKMTGREKAEMLVKRIGDTAATSVSTRKGIVTLKAATQTGTGFVLRWTLDGRYDYAASSKTEDGKSRKVRNASEALKFIGL